MKNESQNNDPTQAQNMRRLNTLASLAGMTAVGCFLVTLVSVIFFPGIFAAPPPTPVNTRTPAPTSTPTVTSTPTPTPTSTPTATPAPRVELVSVTYLQPGAGCQAGITVKVNGEAVTGVFHVWNASSADSAGNASAPETLPPGESNNHLVTLSGARPAEYSHEVWFEYEGGQSNRLGGLICPGLTPGP